MRATLGMFASSMAQQPTLADRPQDGFGSTAEAPSSSSSAPLLIPYLHFHLKPHLPLPWESTFSPLQFPPQKVPLFIPSSLFLFFADITCMR